MRPRLRPAASAPGGLRPHWRGSCIWASARCVSPRAWHCRSKPSCVNDMDVIRSNRAFAAQACASRTGTRPGPTKDQPERFRHFWVTPLVPPGCAYDHGESHPRAASIQEPLRTGDPCALAAAGVRQSLSGCDADLHCIFLNDRTGICAISITVAEGTPASAVPPGAGAMIEPVVTHYPRSGGPVGVTLSYESTQAGTPASRPSCLIMRAACSFGWSTPGAGTNVDALYRNPAYRRG